MKGKIDVEGLREVEGQLQGHAHLVDLVLRKIGIDWSFVLFVFEFDGAGMSWVSNIETRAKLGEVARAQANRLRVAPPGPLVTVKSVHAGPALTTTQIGQLVARLQDLRDVFQNQAPAGWGFALLLVATEGEGRAWIATAERETMPEVLEEFAANLGTPHAFGPGVLGREH